MYFVAIIFLILCLFDQNFGSKCHVEKLAITCTNVTQSLSLDHHHETSHIETLIIANSTIPQLSTLSTFTGIRQLRLKNLSIAEISTGAFENFGKLQRLDLSANKLTHILAGVFDGLTHLKLLRLTGNSISNIERDSFQNLHSLEDLFLDRNNITSLDEGLFVGLIALKTLDVSSNPLRTFPQVRLNSLKFFYASNTYLRSFDTDLVNSSPLWSVNISKNGLKEIDFGHFRTNALDLSENNITTLKNWHQLNSKYLYLSKNNITNLGDIPKNITYLFLRYNQIKNLGETFASQKTIRTLDLGFNRIEEITSRTFWGLEDVNTLYLLHNNITRLHTNIFQKCSDLKYLDLSQNKIEIIEGGAFNGLSSLSHLNISNNHLHHVNFEVFANLEKLIDLAFSHNRISSVDLDEFMDCTSGLKYIQLNYNSWICDDLKKVLQNLENRNVKVNDVRSFYGYNVDGISCRLQNNQ